MSFPMHVLHQLTALVDVSRVASAAYGVGFIQVARRARLLRSRQAFSYDEALREGLLHPGIDDSTLEGYASRHTVLTVQERVNPESLASLTGEKALFYRYCEAADLPVPQLVAVVDPRTGGWAPPNHLFTTGEEFGEVLVAGPRELAVKPSSGGHGHGVRLLTRQGDALVDHDGVTTTAPRLFEELLGDAEFDCHVVQERLRNHPDLDAIVASPALQTVRISTLVDRTGRPQILQAAIRLALARGAVDNFGDGSSGNGYAEIDPDTGRLGPLRLAASSGMGLVSLPTVPSTGAPVEGVRLPGWDDARALALRAALLFLPSRSLGWDVALTPRGAVLVEGNRCWHPWTTPDAAAMVRRMREE
jgi:hypothetical protein